MALNDNSQVSIAVRSQYFQNYKVNQHSGNKLVKDQSKTKQALIQELLSLRQRIADLEQSESEGKRAEEALQKSYALLKSVVESSQEVIIFALDRQYRYIAFNENHHRTMKIIWGVDIALGNSMLEYIKNPADIIKAKNNFDRALSGESFKLAEDYGDTALQRRYYEDIYNPIIDGNGNIIGLTLILTDITERRQMEAMLRESEDRYRTLVENASDIVYRTDSTGHFTFVNQAVLQHVGYKEEEVIGKHYTFFVRPDMREEAIRFFGRQFAKGIQNTYSEYPLISKEGQEFWIGQNTQLIVEDGHVKGFQAVARDITGRKQTEEALRESEELYRTLIETSPDPIIMYSLRGELLTANKQAARTYGVSSAAVFLREVKTVFDLLTDDGKAYAEASFRLTLAAGIPQKNEYLVRVRGGRIIAAEMHSSIVRTATGEPRAFISVVRDITERKRTEEALRKSEAYFRAITENSSDLLLIADAGGTLTYTSPSIEMITGYRPNEVIGKSILDFVMPEDLPKLIEEFGRALQTKNINIPNSFRVRHKNGAELFMEGLGTNLLDDPAIAGFVMTARDITERKQAEEALRESENKFRKLTEASTVGISITDGQRFLYGNPTVLKMSGYSEAEYLSKPMLDFVTPESRELIRRRAMDRLAGKTVPDHYEIQVLTKDGSIKWADVGAAVIDYNGKPATIFTQYDVTNRKAAETEKESLQAQLIRAQKMEALGQLAGGVAHDLNNVLGILSGYSELLLMEIPEGSRSRGHVEKILQSTEKGAAIIQDLLTLARRGVTVSEVINLNSVVFDFLKTPVFENMKDYHPRVTFSTEFDNNLLNIKGSPVHLEKTLMNLVSNAAESISGKGEVTIRTESRYLDKTIRGYDEVREGDYAVLTVSDNGMGIPAEHRAKIFEPFYTKKTMGRSGTGLGLAIVWGTVKDHNGYIDMQTKVGEGNTFTLYFPVTREELTAPQQKEPVDDTWAKVNRFWSLMTLPNKERSPPDC